MLQYNFKTKARSISGWWWGGPSAAHPSRRKDFFLSPRFFTPFRESAAAPSVLRDSNSPAEQLQPACAAVLCFKQETASPTQNLLLLEQIKSKGVEWGDSLPSSRHVSWAPLLPCWHCPETRGPQETAISQQFFCLLLPERHHHKPVTQPPGGAQAGRRQTGKLQPHGTEAHATDSASQPAGPQQRTSPSRFNPRASHLFQIRTHTKQQTVTSQLSGQQKYFHTHPQKSRSFWI